MERVGLAPGAEIGGYTVLAPLGSGGMGTVYRAVDGEGTVVALKLLHPHIGADPAARERLRREVAALQRLRHCGVAAVLDAEADSSEAFLVTELVPGRDLAEHVRTRGPLDAAGLHAMAGQLADALTAVHAAGVVHRDLKPSNVVFGHDGPVLIDFGVAQAMDETRLTSAGFVVGTPGYLAPELIDGAEPTAVTDWWGWAAILAFAATGRAPFGTRPLEVVLARSREGDADVRGLGPVTAGALWDALAAEPEDRARPQEVMAALAEAVRRGERLDTSATAVVPALLGTPQTEATAAMPPAPVPTAVPTVAMDADARPGATAVLPSEHTAVLPAEPDVLPARYPLPPSWPVTDQEGYGQGWSEDADPRDPDPSAPTGFQPANYPNQGPWGNQIPWGEQPAPPTPSPASRWGSLITLGLLIVAAAAARPGITVLALVPVLLVARTIGSVVAATLRRRERTGVRSSEKWRGVFASPWHLLRSIVTILPSLIVAGALTLIVGGVGWWLLHLEGGPDVTTGSDLVPALLAGTAAVGLVALWWGPGAQTTREGGRWLLDAVTPGRWGAVVLVVIALAVSAAVVVALVGGGVVPDFTPFGEPPVPSIG